MSKRKTIAVAIVLALVLLIGGMIAYFTDTEVATNEFTLGDEVDISISETGWTNTAGTTNWTNAAAQGIHPGATVAKAPSIVNESTTTPAYVFAEVVVPCYASTGTTVDTPLFTFTANTGWTLVNTSSVDTTNKTITYVYAYGSSSAMTSLAAEATTSTAVFSEVTLAPTLTAAQKATASATPNIVVNAYGIQTDNVGTTPSAVWANVK
jgi:predicted ribosomally synthesized peptide with SipW-like signal peptide